MKVHVGAVAYIGMYIAKQGESSCHASGCLLFAINANDNNSMDICHILWFLWYDILTNVQRWLNDVVHKWYLANKIIYKCILLLNTEGGGGCDINQNNDTKVLFQWLFEFFVFWFVRWILEFLGLLTEAVCGWYPEIVNSHNIVPSIFNQVKLYFLVNTTVHLDISNRIIEGHWWVNIFLNSSL